jgi:hypothetical protein
VASRETIKSYFSTNDVPTEAQFATLIDSLSHTTEDSLIASEDTEATSIGSLTITSYITITLASGATVKLAVVE